MSLRIVDSEKKAALKPSIKQLQNKFKDVNNQQQKQSLSDDNHLRPPPVPKKPVPGTLAYDRMQEFIKNNSNNHNQENETNAVEECTDMSKLLQRQASVLHAAALDGNEVAVKSHLDDFRDKCNNNNNNNEDDEDGSVLLKQLVEHEEDNRTLLMNAAMMGRLKTVQILVEDYGADVTSGAIELAAKEGHNDVVQFLTAKQFPHRRQSATSINEHHQDEDAISSLMLRYAGPIYSAVIDDDLGKLTALLDQARTQFPTANWLKLVSKNGNGHDEAPFIEAILRGYFNIVKFLLLKIDPSLAEARDVYKNTPLCRAVLANQLGIVVFLVAEMKVETNVRDHLGRTPLMKAAERGHLEIARYLVEEGHAEIGLEDETDDTFSAVDLAAANRHHEIVSFLLAKLNGKPNKSLCIAASLGDLTMVQLIIIAASSSSKIDKNLFHIRDRNGKTAFHLAVEKGHLDVVQFLLKKGNRRNSLIAALITSRGDDEASLILTAKEPSMGAMAIHMAAAFGHLSIVDFLLRKRPDFLEATDKHESTPLCYAVQNGRYDVAYRLIVNGANINVHGYNGKTPLMFASERNDVEMLKMLLSTGRCDVDYTEPNDGNTALHLAALRNSIDAMHLLLQWKKELIRVTNKNGKTAANINDNILFRENNEDDNKECYHHGQRTIEIVTHFHQQPAV